jgi:macrolide transport system ATP-binding/permease protein
VIKVKGLRKTYRLGGSAVHALDGVDLTVEDGDFLAVMGPSGSGKSTLLQVLGLLDNPDSGSYELFGRQVAGLGADALAEERSRRLGFIFQQFNLLPRTSAAENVRLPELYYPVQAPKEKAVKLLQTVGLGDRVEHKPNELSGGQQQRVAIARALYNDPVVVFADEPTGNLDSKSTVEILKLLQELNAKGITIIMVTHEAEVGAMARRRIVMRDGKIVEDKRQKPLPKITSSVKAGSPRPALSPAATPKSSRLPTLRDMAIYAQQALRSLLANKLRSALSMLGILIGVAAVVAVLAIGAGAKKAMETQMSSLGSNLLLVWAGASSRGGVSQGAGSGTRVKFTDADLEALMRAVPLIKRSTGDVNGRAQATAAGKNWSTQVAGTGVDYPGMHSSEPALGRWFNLAEIQTRARVVVVGVTVARNLWGEANPLGETVRLNKVAFTVIGVLPVKGSSGFQDQDDKVIIPSTTARYRLLGKEYLDVLSLEIVDQPSMPEAQTQITDFLKARYRIPAATDDAVSVFNMADVQKTMSAVTGTITLVLSIVAGISLVVGGIGIMNIMLVTVTERTREIGLRKALGAKGRDILSQFLIESVVVSLSGGAAGLVIGAGSSMLVSLIAGWAVSVSLTSVLVAVGFSSAVGLIFGLWPAWQASNLSPITALRSE